MQKKVTTSFDTVAVMQCGMRQILLLYSSKTCGTTWNRRSSLGRTVKTHASNLVTLVICHRFMMQLNNSSFWIWVLARKQRNSGILLNKNHEKNKYYDEEEEWSCCECRMKLSLPKQSYRSYFFLCNIYKTLCSVAAKFSSVSFLLYLPCTWKWMT